MKTYHILFKEYNNSLYSTGKDYLATNPIDAFIAFEKEYPSAILLMIASEELLMIASKELLDLRT